MSKIKHPQSRWNKGNRFPTGDVSGAWNRNLQHRERAPTEKAYIDSFAEGELFKHGAKVRARK